MAKRDSIRIGPRDMELLQALDVLVLTPAQLQKFSATFAEPFPDETTIRRRLRRLKAAGLVRSFPYAFSASGQSPSYWKLTQSGFRFLYGDDVELPKRRVFEALSPGRHHHTQCLSDLVIHLLLLAQRDGLRFQQLTREGSVKIETPTFTLYPDFGFQLVFDTGKQGNISTTLLGNVELAGTDSFFNPALEPEIDRLIRKSPFDKIDCIPCDFSIERFNMTDPRDWENTGLQLSLIDPLGEVASFYDYILLDCPADISLITYAALCASDFLIVPLEAADWGALGTQHVRRAFDHVRSRFNSKLQHLGYVASRFKKLRKYQKSYLEQLREHFGPDAFDTVVADLAPFEQSVTDRIPIVLHSPSSHASSIARNFFDELEARIEKLQPVCTTGRSISVPEPVDTIA